MPDSQSLKRPPVVTAESSSFSLGMRPQGPLARPLYPRSGSSSSSLGSLEQSIRPFQDFIKQTRAIEPEKPLPPIPSMPRHLSNSPPGTEDLRLHSLYPSEDIFRRSSSVYSRTPSQWTSDERSFDSFDIGHDSCLPEPQTDASHVPDLNVRPATPDALEARRFSPLFISPSPTLSAGSSLPGSRPTTLMLNLPLVRERPRVRLMSLDKANLAFKAPGAVHLLPEELRAQSTKKLDTRADSRRDSKDMFNSPRPPPLPPAPFTHAEERSRSRSRSASTSASVSPYSKLRRGSTQQSSAVESGASVNSFHVGTGPARIMALPSRSVPLPLRRSEDPIRRGRSTERRCASGEVAAPQRFFVQHLDPRTVPRQRSSDQSESTTYDSEEDVRGHMKMIPQPLFQPKFPTQHRKPSNMGVGSSFRHSHFRTQQNSRESARSSRPSAGGLPLRLSLTPPPGDLRHRQSKSSTTGMIPISPPSENDSGQHRIPPAFNKNHIFPSKAKSKPEANVSSMYPQIMGRMKKKSKSGNTDPGPKRPSIGAPLLPADVVAAVLLTPESTPQTSPLASNTILTTGLKKTSSNLSSESKRPLYQRFKGMTKHVRKGSKQQDASPAESPVARRESLHLFASAVKASQMTYSEWSETAKATWDHARSHTFPSSHHDVQATPPDENEGKMEDDTNLRRPTLFGPLMESYRETKAQKRREDLKKTIKVVTPFDEASEVGDSESEDSEVVQKRLNGYNWM